MKALQHFQRMAMLPAEFGPERSYVRLVYVADDKTAGADADVEYRLGGPRGDQVVVTVTEWVRDKGQTQRNVSQVVTFDVASGEIVRPVVDQQEDLAALLSAMDGMRPIEDGE